MKIRNDLKDTKEYAFLVSKMRVHEAKVYLKTIFILFVVFCVIPSAYAYFCFFKENIVPETLLFWAIISVVIGIFYIKKVFGKYEAIEVKVTQLMIQQVRDRENCFCIYENKKRFYTSEEIFYRLEEGATYVFLCSGKDVKEIISVK